MEPNERIAEALESIAASLHQITQEGLHIQSDDLVEIGKEMARHFYYSQVVSELMTRELWHGYSKPKDDLKDIAYKDWNDNQTFDGLDEIFRELEERAEE